MSKKVPIAVMCLTLLAAGCDQDERVIQLSRESLQRQAEQNQQMARQSQQVAEATKTLVDAQKKLHGDLHTERQSLDRQHEELEDERRSLATARHRDPIIAAAITWSSVLIACLAPLALAGYLLYVSQRSDPDDALGELLVHELTSTAPTLFERPVLTLDALPMQPTPALDVEPDPCGSSKSTDS